VYLFWWLVSFIPEPDVEGHIRAEDGEQLECAVSHHPIVYVLPVLEAVGGVAMLGASVFVPGELSLVVLLLGVAMLCLAGWLALLDHMDRLIVTNQRVFRITGLIGWLEYRRATMPLQRALEITVVKSVVGRFFKYGHLVFDSAPEDQGLREFRYVADVDKRDRQIQSVVRSGN